MNIPTWKEAPGEGRRGLASGREEEGEMLGRPRVRSGSDPSLTAQLTWKVRKEPPIRDASPGLALGQPYSSEQ